MTRVIAQGAQTNRQGGAGPVRGLLGGKDLTGRLSDFSKTYPQLGTMNVC